MTELDTRFFLNFIKPQVSLCDRRLRLVVFHRDWLVLFAAPRQQDQGERQTNPERLILEMHVCSSYRRFWPSKTQNQMQKQAGHAQTVCHILYQAIRQCETAEMTVVLDLQCRPQFRPDQSAKTVLPTNYCVVKSKNRGCSQGNRMFRRLEKQPKCL